MYNSHSRSTLLAPQVPTVSLSQMLAEKAVRGSEGEGEGNEGSEGSEGRRTQLAAALLGSTVLLDFTVFEEKNGGCLVVTW